MITKILSCQDPSAIELAIQTLESGGLVAFPTDTVYGLAAPVNNSTSIERLFDAKGRDFNKAIAVLIAGSDQISGLTSYFNPAARRLVEHFWPGALTVVVAKHPDLPEILSPLPTIGIRMPDHNFVIALLKQTGPLATTSANLSGAPNPLTVQDVLSQLEGRIELVLDGGRTPGGIPSTVVDCTQPDPVILRQGAISLQEIQSALNFDKRKF
jgi:L-threonylcarbamoyladenylate synthase